MSRDTRSGLTSIIVPCCNQRAFTQLCLRALFRHTRPDWELIVVDNGSTDGTGAYLEGVRDAAAVPVTLIANRENLEFPRAVNQGLREARGEFLVLLNNDAVVTDGWLDQLIALASMRMPAAVQGAGGSGSWDAERTEGADGGEAVGDAVPHGRRGQAPGLVSSGVVPDVGGAGSQSPFSFAPPSSDGAGSQSASSSVSPGGGGPVGLVGPMSNYAAPPQLVEDVPYRDLDEMHAFAGRWRERHRGQWFTAPKLSGFCLLIRRAVYEAVGGLDERFGIGFFDDDDLAVRARRAGFELAVARDLFVHHFGSRTFVGNGIDAGRLLEENARRFEEKWGDAAPAGRRVALSPWGAGGPGLAGGDGVPHGERGQGPGLVSAGAETAIDGAGSQSPFTFAPPLDVASGGHSRGERGLAPGLVSAGAATAGDGAGSRSPFSFAPARAGAACWVSLTMIVRDEEKNLPRCLASVRGVFDEVVVVDTGSVDRTREIAREFGARVVEFAWVDDFATARNAALDAATGDYAFWLDGDDVVEPAQREKLVALLDGLRAGDDAGYVVKCACDPGQDGSGGQTVVDHVRLFPLRPDVRWTYRVHEQILPALRRAGIPVRWTDLVVRHTGYADVALRERKLERDARILEAELRERPDEPFVLFNLGSIAIERRDWPGALGYLRRSLRASVPGDSITRKLFALIARAHQMMDDPEAAIAACDEGLALDPQDAELLFRKAIVHRRRGEPAEAEACWRRILTLRRPERFASVDMGIYGHLTRRNLAALAAARGDREEELRLWRAVLAECPGDREAEARLRRVADVGASV